MSTTEQVNDRVALVSGGSRGLGRLLVERLLEDGWRVATFSRSCNDFISDTLDYAGGRFLWEEADLTDLQQVQGFVRSVKDSFGRIDLLVNNAGVLHQELLLTIPPAQIDRLITVNLTAPITLAQSCARAMSSQGSGLIVNVSSINAIRGYRGVSVYSAAKAGMDGLSRSLARELGEMGIRVNSVVPGFFDSDMTAEVTPENRERIERRTPLKRLGAADEIVDTILYLVSPAASFVTGQTLVVDGGITC